MDGLVLADIYGSDQTSEHTYESVVHSTSSPPRAPADTIQRQRSQTRSLTNPSVSSFSPLANPQINQMNQQCFDKACRNLKIQLSILVTANLVVLVIFIWNVMYTNAREQNPTVVSSYVKADSLKDNFRLCTKCSALRTSYGGIDDVIRRTRMDENPDVCCFQTISQFLDLFEQVCRLCAVSARNGSSWLYAQSRIEMGRPGSMHSLEFKWVVLALCAVSAWNGSSWLYAQSRLEMGRPGSMRSLGLKCVVLALCAVSAWNVSSWLYAQSRLEMGRPGSMRSLGLKWVVLALCAVSAWNGSSWLYAQSRLEMGRPGSMRSLGLKWVVLALCAVSDWNGSSWLYAQSRLEMGRPGSMRILGLK